MSSLTNINNNTRVVNVGRTTPVAPGQQPASKSIPVVLATDQSAIPVVEQNKVQSEVSLSLLGIPRSEVALGIFADVNTYDVNPSEWSSSPQYYVSGDIGGHGIKHLPTEAGALVEAPRDESAVLTSKRFFRYQPGRVSAATFGVKSSVSTADFARNPAIRKYGIFDNFDGYYWETKQSGNGDNFSVVRRTQSLMHFPPSPFGLTNEVLRKPDPEADDEPIPYNQTDDYRIIGKEGKELKSDLLERDRQVLSDNILSIAETAFNNLLTASGGTNDFADFYNNTNLNGNNTGSAHGLSTAYDRYEFKQKCHRDVQFALKMMLMDLEWGGDAHTRINTKNYQTGLFESYFSNGSGTPVPPGQFELDLHTNARAQAVGLPGLTATGVSRIGALYDFLVKVSGGNDKGFFNRIVAGVTATSAYPQLTGTNASLSTLSYGSKSKVDTFIDTRKHYWSYFVSSFVFVNSDPDNTTTKQPYKFSAAANYLPEGYNVALIGETLAGADYPWAAGDTIGSVSNITATDALAANEFYRNIKYKCARDLEYVVNGYKNDIVGGGNAETLYNASMYYKGAGLSIFTQEDSDIPREVAKHNHLKQWIQSDLEDTNITGFGLAVTSPEIVKLNTLYGIIDSNFVRETKEGFELGGRGFAGNLIALRDGLLMTHAAVNDPSMLKDAKQIVATVKEQFDDSQPTCFKLATGNVTFGQKVKVLTTGNETQISDGNNFTSTTTGNVVETEVAEYGGIYNVSRVYGPTGSEFTLQDQAGNDIYAMRGSADAGTLITDAIVIETIVPFMGDIVYNPAEYRLATGIRAEGTIQSYDGTDDTIQYTENTDPFPKGMQWPYRYSSSAQLGDATAKFIGHIDTSLSPNDSTEIGTIRRQYDDINFTPEYINWIKNNVKPEYWGVYEYRIPRSRFSHDKLDGKTSKRVYSDLATGNTGIVRPGMEVLDEDGIWTDAVSEYDFDFTKVTMLKIEFSWYGAVGALFLAYVPIGNGEARWVRVHHLRASNQLKIASLGNATLPITYNVYGGGSPATLGDEETATHTYGSSQSHHIVKYGASYYIDGGDRGTVRLYSHNNNDPVGAYGKKWVIGQTISNAQVDLTGVSQTDDGEPLPVVSGTLSLEYFMGAELKTNSALDAGIKVIWVDTATEKLYFSRQPIGTGMTLIPDRGELVYGLETKDVILSTVEGNPVRNRVQVYPTKLSTANLDAGPVRLTMKRTPIFQTLTAIGNGSALAIGSDPYIVSATNEPLNVTETGTYLQNGESIFGWFQGLVGAIDEETVFGRLYKKTNNYYFEVLQSFGDTITLNADGKFLPDVRYMRNSSGEVIGLSDATTVSKTEVPLQDTLTSIKVFDNPVTPIPGTGANVATLYLAANGTEQLDLDTYFDYNKEYLSYPLTDEAETLYFAVDKDTVVDSSAPNEIAIGLTWEEQ